ncbi:MAG: 2,3-diphosphoglycerate synthetase [Actinobacteria bacterium]|nr:2,3-diphosphoglycerate synthetase [Actinomycetota bacterium]
MRALALIDGEHYAPVVADALKEVPHEVVGALLVGGTEKLKGEDEYGVDVAEGFDDALERFDPEVAVDLSDEPVLGPRERFRLASRFLARGVAYEGADFALQVPAYEEFDLPSLAVIGTGKRLGKTAVTGYVARLLSEDHDLVVVSMGRGGPAEPQVADVQPTVEDLLELSRSGAHAASDYLETAALSGVPTIGCRRCGGGLAGVPWTTNLSDGMQEALRRSPELVLFDGSGAAIPPVAARKRILVAGARQPTDLVVGYLNAYRILVSDLVILTMAEEGSHHRELAEAIREVKDIPVVSTVLRPRPVERIADKRVAFFTTADESASDLLGRHLRQEHGASDVTVSCNLSRRDELRADLERADAEIYLVEIKAAAIDVVCEAASENGRQVVFADNDVLPLEGQPDLDGAIRALAEAAREAPQAVGT